MKLARYVGNGEIAIVEEATPRLPEGGLLIKTEACGLCSGELMDWYMDRKVPHVLGHEVSGVVVESDDARFPVGCRVFPHHHAPCMACDFCRRGLYVHCPQWKSTKLLPGGMSEFFAVPAGNLNDTIRTDDLRPEDAALIEPLACVVKGITSVGRKATWPEGQDRIAVIGLGVMGLMHMFAVCGAVGYEINPKRAKWARSLDFQVESPNKAQQADLVFVCPGNQTALDHATSMVAPGGTIVLFAPMPPGKPTPVDLNALYFKDARLLSTYSCGPEDTRLAARMIREGTIKAEQVVSDFIRLEDLPTAYRAMKSGDILKAMVMFD